MRIAGLFAGIGGFEHGLHQAGHETVLLCEIKPEAQAVLREKFPGIRIDPDVRGLGPIPKGTEVICAGFPCQDLSQAGRTNGLAGEQSGLIHAVFEALRTRRIRPLLVIENVPFMLQLHGGAAMRTIIEEVEALGYRWAYRVVDSFSFGLPQRRERVFMVASHGDLRPGDVLLVDDRPLSRPETAVGRLAHGFYWTEGKEGLGWAVDAVPTVKNGSTIGIASPPAILMPNLEIVTPSIQDAEAMQGFDPGWTEAAETVERPSARWSLVGSAVSVPVARWLGEKLARPGEVSAGDVGPFPAEGKLPRAAYGGANGRFAVAISTDPVGKRGPHLATFIERPAKPLSAKATNGFYSRATHPDTRLRFADGFIESVKRHLDTMVS
ncbi:MAG: DNA cytosine methyltransferase [Betaproteobacteria bacterium]|nr:DNA cytosine methyltransferase [Betaproteobacteria bacterium]